MDRFQRQEKMGRCRGLLGKVAAPQDETAPPEPNPVTQPGHETRVDLTRVCPRCGAGRVVVLAEFLPMSVAEWITAGHEPCLILDCS